MQVYIWASGLVMEISDVTLIDGCVPSVGDKNRGVPLQDLPKIEPAVWFKVLVLDGISIDCIRRAIMWNCDSALGRKRSAGARAGMVGPSGGDIPDARVSRQRITESVYNGGEFFAYNMSEMFSIIQNTAFSYNKGEVSLDALHEELLRMLHCYILPAIPITADVLPLIQAAYSAQQQFVKLIDEEIVQHEQKLWRHDRARLRQLVKFVESLNTPQSASLCNVSSSFVNVLFADVQKELHLAKESLEISQQIVEDAKKQHYQGHVDITYVNNKRATRDENHERHASLLQAREALHNHIVHHQCQQSSLKHTIKARLKPRVEIMDPIQATYHKLSEMGRDMQMDIMALIEKKLLILSVKEAIRGTIIELQVLGDTMGIQTNKLLCSRSTDVLRASAVATDWLSLEDRVSHLLDDTQHPVTQKYNRFCARVIDLCQAAQSEKEKADWSLLSASVNSNSGVYKDENNQSPQSGSFDQSMNYTSGAQCRRSNSESNKHNRTGSVIGRSESFNVGARPNRTSSVSTDADSMSSSPAFSPSNADLLDSTRVQASFSSDSTSSGSSGDFMPNQAFYSVPAIPSQKRESLDSSYNFVCYLEECPYACCTAEDREAFVLGDEEAFNYGQASPFNCYLEKCESCSSSDCSVLLLNNVPEIRADKECTDSSTMPASIVEGIDVLSYSEKTVSVTSTDKDASFRFEDSFASSGVFSQDSVNEGPGYLGPAELAYGSLLQLDDSEGKIGGSDWCDVIIIHDSEKNPVRKLIDRLKLDIPKHLNKMTKLLSSEMQCSSPEGHKRIRLRYECHFYQATFDQLIRLYDVVYAPTGDKLRDCLSELVFTDLQLDSSMVACMVGDGTPVDGHAENNIRTHEEEVVMRKKRGDSGGRRLVDSGLCHSDEVTDALTADSRLLPDDTDSSPAREDLGVVSRASAISFTNTYVQSSHQSRGSSHTGQCSEPHMQHGSRRPDPKTDAVKSTGNHQRADKKQRPCNEVTLSADLSQSSDDLGSVLSDPVRRRWSPGQPLKLRTGSVLSKRALSNERHSRVICINVTHHVSEPMLESIPTNSPSLTSPYITQPHTTLTESSHQKSQERQAKESEPQSELSPATSGQSANSKNQSKDFHDDLISSGSGSNTGISLLPEYLVHLQPALDCINAAVQEQIPLLKLQHLATCLREVNKQISRLQMETSGQSEGACSDDLIDTLILLLCHEGATYTPQLFSHIMFLVDFIPSFFINGPYNYSLVQFCVAFQFLQDRLVLFKRSS